MWNKIKLQYLFWRYHKEFTLTEATAIAEKLEARMQYYRSNGFPSLVDSCIETYNDMIFIINTLERK